MADEEVNVIGTDEAILNSIGEGGETTPNEDTSTDDQATAAESTTETQTPSNNQSAGPSNEQQQGKPVSGPQDLVDREGNIIAKGGVERRHYETAQREKQRAETVTTELEGVKAQLEAVTAAGNVGSQYNLSPEEVTTGAQFISAYKNDPVGTIQYILTQAQSNGYNVDSIINGGTDMGAVKQMLDKALEPLVNDRQERVVNQEVQDEALRVYQNFSNQHPDAAIHENSLAQLLREDTSLSPEAAYYKLQAHYAQNGLDWTKSLEQLIQDQQNGSSVNTQPQPPEGGGVALSNVTDTAQVADVNTSTSDIIRQAMAEAGIN